MHLSISIAARDRAFSKAMRRVRPKREPFCLAFDSIVLVNPIHESLLLGVSDELAESTVQVVPNKDGFFQVLCGFDTGVSLDASNDSELARMLIEKVAGAVALCPLSAPDRLQFEGMLDRWLTIRLA